MSNPSKIFMKCEECRNIMLMIVGQKTCDRCLLQRERERTQQLREALQDIAAGQDTGRHDGLPKQAPLADHEAMFIAQRAIENDDEQQY
jgi:hypothetical protein